MPIKTQHNIILQSIGLNTLKAFQFKGVWIYNTPESENQVIAHVSFSDNADIKEMTERYMKSSEFIEEMTGFDRSKITNVETKIMKSAFFIVQIKSDFNQFCFVDTTLPITGVCQNTG